MKRWCLFLVAFFLPSVYAQQLSKEPSRIILNLTDQPANSMAITWRTTDSVSGSHIQYAIDKDSFPFAETFETYPVKTQRITLNNGKTVYHHSAVLSPLLSGTDYLYRVGSPAGWSEWNVFRTAERADSSFEFVFFGDPQHGFRTYLPRLFRKAHHIAPQAAFWLYIGDLVDESEKDEMWDDFFYTLGYSPRMIPSVMIPGNHEYTDVRHSTNKKRYLTPLWRPHFTLPENGIADLAETSYWFDYQGVRFILLNSEEKLSEQARWLDSLLSTGKTRWTIVAFHQPVFSMGARRDGKRMRETFMPIFDNHAVDVVLTGHDHVYSRSYKLVNGKVVPDSLPGTVYIVSVAGTKQYPLNLNHASLMAKYAENVMLFQVFSVSRNSLKMKAYTVSGKVFDEFELTKPK